MEIIIKDKKQNDLLKRTEILAIIKSEITPKMQDATKTLAEYLHAAAELVAIKRLKGKFGRQEFEVEACVYESREAMQKIESKPKAKKEEQAGKAEEKAPQAEKKAEEKKDEKSAQTEKKAEQKQEQKPEQKEAK